ncbi:MAG: T9SS type A sorting domain-containing protein [Flavobacteriales bacterium]
MKGIYTFGLALTVAAGSTYAQNGPGNRLNSAKLKPNSVVTSPAPNDEHPATPESATQRDVLFTEDFANGLAGNNGVGGWTVDGPNGNIWRFNNHTPTGAYTTGDQYIQSTTAANGAAIFASDSANSDWSGGSPVIVASPVDFEASLVSPLLDLSATPFVEISFQQRSRFCCGSSPFFLEVSTDGGSTWPTSFITNEGLPLNQGSPGVSGGPVTTETRSFSLLGAIAANPSNVRFRFRHNGEAGSSHYYWQIDDVSINTLPSNEIILKNAFTSQFGGGYEFGYVPQSQMLSTLDVGASIINYGANPQTNVVVNVSLKNASNVEVGSSVITVGTIAPGDTMPAEAQLTLPDPTNVGIYTAYFTMTSDSIAEDNNIMNNAAQRAFSVSDALYSIDGIGVYPTAIATSSQVGTNSFALNTQDVRLLNYFEVHTPATFYGVEVALGSTTAAGSFFSVSVYDTTDVLATPANLNNSFAESEFHVITTAEKLARKARVAFLDPLPLPEGAYFVSANMYQADGNNMFIVDDTTVPQPSIASMLYLPNDEPANQNLYGGNGTAWGVRISTDASISVKEVNGLPGVSMYPNPTTGMLHITTKKAETTTVVVRNVLGAVVKTATFNGTENTIDLSGNAAGVYTVRIGNGSNFAVQLVTLK